MRFKKWLRGGWAILSFFVVESAVFAVSLGPAALFLNHQRRFISGLSSDWMGLWVALLSLVPFYLSFIMILMVLSAASCRLIGWRTPPNIETRLEDLSWPLLDWVRYSISIRIVEVFAGSLFRSTPLWTFYMRLNGATLGRRVHVNSLEVTDHNLIELGDDVVVGGGVHLSGHTVEEGVLKTAPVRLERGVTVGVGSVVNIGCVAGSGSEIGALSYVPKFSILESGCAYAGVPIHKIRLKHRLVDPTIGRPRTGSSVA
jgi:acetyltransferase-like isoleucine patch superfamily enzyme